MKADTIKYCFEKRLLRRIPKDTEKSRKSLEISGQRIEKAKNAIELGVIPYAIIESYTAMFHAARAVLYQDGIQEKSHWAIYIYLREKYPKIPSNLLDIHRTERHETLYGLQYEPTTDDAKTAIKDAEKFIKHIKQEIKKTDIKPL